MKNRLAKQLISRLGRTFGPYIKRACGFGDPIHDIRRLAAVIHPGCILDIGAHVGEVARRLAKAVPGVPVHAFEPTPRTAALLRRSCRHVADIVVHELAVGDRSGERTFFLNRNDETNSLLDNAEGNDRFLAGHTAHTDRVKVTTTSLDDWWRQHSPSAPLFIKADVQGAELDLISGGSRTLRDSTALILTEVSLMPLYAGAGDLFDIHAALTRTLPFTLLNIYRTYRNKHGQAMWADAMWLHTDYVGLVSKS